MALIIMYGLWSVLFAALRVLKILKTSNFRCFIYGTHRQNSPQAAQTLPMGAVFIENYEV